MGLGIPAEALIQPYKIATSNAVKNTVKEVYASRAVR
jgi:hypothetical protein